MYDSDSFPVVGGGDGALTVPDSSRIYQTANARTILYPPKELNAQLRRLGGENRHGEPNYRLVWGRSRLEIIWSRKLGGYERRPKYFQRLNRWIVEMWHPPAMPQSQWERETREWVNGMPVDVLGPYPSRGDYEILTWISSPHAPGCEIEIPAKFTDGECICGGSKYVALTPAVCDLLMTLVKRSREVTAADRRNYFLDSEEKRKQGEDAYMDDVIKDAQPPFGGNLTWLSMRPGPRPYKANAGLVPSTD